MRFLIADDVFLARKAVEKLVMDWDPSSKIVASCDNGIRVLKLLSQEPVDVLILDIRMPGVDGLQLSQTVRRDYPRVKTLLVTGYADFEYAQEALKNGVFRYLLKPLKKDELFAALDELKGMLALREKRPERDEVRRAMSSYRMMGFLSGGEDIEPQYPLPEAVLERGYIMAMVLCHGITYEQLSRVTEETLKQEVFLYGDMLHGARWLLLLCNEEGIPAERFAKETLAQLETLTQQIPARYGLVAMTGVAPVSCRVADMPASYLRAKRALAMRLIQKKERVFLFEEPSGEKRLLSPEDVRMIRGKLQAHKSDEVMRLMEKKLSALPRLRLHQAEQIYHDFVSIALSLRMERGLTGEGRLAPRQLWDFDTKEQVNAYLEELIYGESETRDEGEGNLITEIKTFLQENYYCEISLNELAATKYFMNPNYLSRLFKSRVGIGFSRYLLQLRMEKAKELLQKGDMSINEIASMVGYASTSYFIANFKKVYGDTPGSMTEPAKERG